MFQKQIPGYSITGVYTLGIEYDRGAGTVDLFINGEQFNTNAITVGALNSSEFGAVGVRVHGSVPANTAYVSSFEYAVVPEPSAVALALFAGGAFFAIRLRKSRIC